jgi:hypothetical protein
MVNDWGRFPFIDFDLCSAFTRITETLRHIYDKFMTSMSFQNYAIRRRNW